MKILIILITSLALMACGSNNKKKENKDTHNHETCSGHDHSHAGHDHADDKAHDHETCGHDHSAHADDKAHDHAGDHNHAHPDPNYVEVELKDSQVKAAKIQVYEVQPIPFSSIIKTSGKISSNNKNRKVIVAPISGIVKIVSNKLVDGASIKLNELVATISSSNMEGGDKLVTIIARYNAAKLEFDRAKSLIGDQLISQKEYNQIEVDFKKTETEYKLIKLSSKDGLKIKSPIKGYLNELLVANGEYVEAGSPIAVITTNKRFTLTAYVSERYFPRLKNITSANFKTSYSDTAYDIKDLNGTFIAYGKGENDETKLVPVTFEFDSNNSIIAGSYVEVYLKEKTSTNSITIPLSALSEEQNVYYVYTHRGGNLYRKNEVKLGNSDGVNIEVLDGINIKDKVVVNGTYQIKLASSSGVIPSACGHAH